MINYQEAKKIGLTSKNRWEEGIPHHPKSEELMEFLKEHDIKDYKDYFEWSTGGDGDNGEILMYQMDAFFELQEINENKKIETSRNINNKEYLKKQKAYLALDEDLKIILDSDDNEDALEDRMEKGDRTYGLFSRDNLLSDIEDRENGVIDMGGVFLEFEDIKNEQSS